MDNRVVAGVACTCFGLGIMAAASLSKMITPEVPAALAFRETVHVLEDGTPCVVVWSTGTIKAAGITCNYMHALSSVCEGGQVC